jgi:dihydroxyacid dehydratase/phosphogluconate dehydratase
MTANGLTLGDALDSWEKSDRRNAVRKRLIEVDGVHPDEVIMPSETAKSRGLTCTVTFPSGNIAPEGAVIKSTAIDPEVVGDDGIYRQIGPARVFVTERDAIAAVKSTGTNRIREGDVMSVLGRGPSGSGMEETYQITSALKYLPFGNKVELVTDARFSGVSTGACIGHMDPESLAGGPISRVRMVASSR